jgi:hypothetical protein
VSECETVMKTRTSCKMANAWLGSQFSGGWIGRCGLTVCGVWPQRKSADRN